MFMGVPSNQSVEYLQLAIAWKIFHYNHYLLLLARILIDIDMVRLNGSIEFNNITQPIELHTQSFNAGDLFTMTG